MVRVATSSACKEYKLLTLSSPLEQLELFSVPETPFHRFLQYSVSIWPLTGSYWPTFRLLLKLVYAYRRVYNANISLY